MNEDRIYLCGDCKGYVPEGKCIRHGKELMNCITGEKTIEYAICHEHNINGTCWKHSGHSYEDCYTGLGSDKEKS